MQRAVTRGLESYFVSWWWIASDNGTVRKIMKLEGFQDGRRD